MTSPFPKESTDGTELFRKEMRARKKQNINGEVIVYSPISHRVIIAFLFLCTMLSVLFFAVSSFKTTIIADGVVALDEGVLRISAPEPGIINAANIFEGQAVTTSEILFLIDTDTQISSESKLSDAIRAELILEKNAIEEQITLLKDQHPKLLANVKSNIQSLTSEKSSLLAQLASHKKREELEFEALVSYQTLYADEAASKRELNGQQAIALSARQSRMALESKVIIIDREISDNQSMLELIPAEQSEKIEVLNAQLSRIRAKLIENSVAGEQKIVSPKDGHIANIFVKVGQRVNKGDPLASLVPQTSNRRIELFVPSEKIGQIESGQRAIIRYNGFPYRQYGVYGGSVGYVSDSSVFPSEWFTADKQDEPGFIVHIELDHNAVSNGIHEYTLKPGMTASVDIQLETKKLWNLLAR